MKVDVFFAIGLASVTFLFGTNLGAYYGRRERAAPPPPSCPAIVRELAECRGAWSACNDTRVTCEQRSRELLAAAVNCGGH